MKPEDDNRDSEATEVELSPSSGKGKDHTDFDDDETQQIDSHTTATAANISDAPGFTHHEHLDPEDYQNAKKKLKRAVLEHYR